MVKGTKTKGSVIVSSASLNVNPTNILSFATLRKSPSLFACLACIIGLIATTSLIIYISYTTTVHLSTGANEDSSLGTSSTTRSPSTQSTISTHNFVEDTTLRNNAPNKQLRGKDPLESMMDGMSPSIPNAKIEERNIITSARMAKQFASLSSELQSCKQEREQLTTLYNALHQKYLSIVSTRQAWSETKEPLNQEETTPQTSIPRKEGIPVTNMNTKKNTQNIPSSSLDSSTSTSSSGSPSTVTTTKRTTTTTTTVETAMNPVQKKSNTDTDSSSSSSSLPPITSPLVVIGIPTIRRDNDPDYLVRTVDFILEQTRWNKNNPIPTITTVSQAAELSAQPDVEGPHPLHLRILVLCQTRADSTTGKSNHKAFETLVERHCGTTGTLTCSVLRVGSHEIYARAGSPLVLARNGHSIPFDGQDEGNPNVPGYRVRQQTRDVADLLHLAESLFGYEGGKQGTVPFKEGIFAESAKKGAGDASSSSTAMMAATFVHTPRPMAAYMFMEDDFRLCPNAAKAIGYMLYRATAELGEWNAIRASYGLNGALIRGYDVPVLSAYYLKHIARRPPDHLLVEWFAGEKPESAKQKDGRLHLAFRYNILEHFGFSSSLRAQTSPIYAYCYDEMNEAVVFEVEAYKVSQCGHDDIWPCWRIGDPRYTDTSSITGVSFGGIPASMEGSGLSFPSLGAEARSSSVQTW